MVPTITGDEMSIEEQAETRVWQAMSNTVIETTTGTLYVWQSTQNGKWYRSGVANNGENCLPSQGYTTAQSAADLDAVRHFVSNPTIVNSEPPRRRYTRRQKKLGRLSRLLKIIRAPK